MSRLISFILSILLFGCSTPQMPDDLGGDPTHDYEPSHISIAALKSYYLGGIHPVVDDIYVEGRVVASDMYGEYRRAMVVEDSTAAIEVRVDMTDLYRCFPVGASVRIACDDLWLSSSHGAVLVGAEPQVGDYLVGYIGDRLLDRSVVLIDSVVVEVIGIESFISQLDQSMISRCVVMRDMRFVPSDYTTFATRDTLSGRFVDTSHLLCDRSGDEIELRVASTVSYAGVALPHGEFDIQAIVEYDSSLRRYALRTTSFMISAF